MAVKCDVNRTYTLDGPDAEALRDLCELARVILNNHRVPTRCEHNVDGSKGNDLGPCCTYMMVTMDVAKIRNLMDTVFED